MESIQDNLNSLSMEMLKDSKGSKKLPPLLPPTVSVMIVSKVVPPKKLIRIKLPHLSDNISLCFLVKDMRKLDFNKSADAWKLRWKTDLAKSDLSPLNLPSPTFLPLRELTLAYQSYSSKRQLAATFDVFLADRRIVHLLPTKLGKAFYGETRGKIPVPVDLSGSRNLAKIAHTECSTVLLAVRGNGTAESVPVGNIELPLQHLKENILSVCEKVATEWPSGGLSNVRSIYVQSGKQKIPIYLDPTEANLSAIPPDVQRYAEAKLNMSVIQTNTDGEKSNAFDRIKKPKKLSMNLLSRVVEDLPLPEGGLEQVLNFKVKKTGPKRISQRKKSQPVRKIKRQS
ncbi:unnamed protein product [Calicophoron daubneyi]|uniref:Ribosomal L1 domain-containing protein 1 n=1 Tax=Calicophoron daubneyi TaxID=300641 RepID=A0AAV2SZ01_CALDB